MAYAPQPGTPPRIDVPSPISGMNTLVIAAFVIAALYLGREIFVPMALAVLLSFVLAPLVRLLQHIRLGRAVSVISVVLLAFTLIFGLGAVMATQVNELAGDLPRYQATMREKITSLRGATAASSSLSRAADVLSDLGKELERKDATPPAPPAIGSPAAPAEEPKPVPVEVRQPDPGTLETLRAIITPLIHPLATTGLVVIFVVFILFQREDLRNRLIRLAGSHDLQRTTAAIDDAAQRLSRLFLTQIALNASFGVLIGAGLWFIGVPSPILWGILAGIMRFVPYIGSFIAAAFPLALAAAVDPGWTMVLWTLGLFLVLEPLAGHVVEPMVYGHSTGLSPVAIVVSATFWTWLWGPIGLVLAAPLTVCMVVLGRHVDRLEFLDVMLGDRPPLTAAQSFYQRLLARDPAEAAEQAEDFLEEKPLGAYYDEVALAGLQLAQIDAARGMLDLPRLGAIRDTIRDLVEDLDEYEDLPPEEPPVSPLDEDDEAAPATLPVLTPEALKPAWRGETPVICTAGRNPLDEAAALMLAQLLRKHGIAAAVQGPQGLSETAADRSLYAGAAMLCLSYVDLSSPAHIRYAIRRLRRMAPGAKVLIGCWSADLDPPALEALRESVKADLAATSLRQALALCIGQAADPDAVVQAVREDEVTAA